VVTKRFQAVDLPVRRWRRWRLLVCLCSTMGGRRRRAAPGRASRIGPKASPRSSSALLVFGVEDRQTGSFPSVWVGGRRCARWTVVSMGRYENPPTRRPPRRARSELRLSCAAGEHFLQGRILPSRKPASKQGGPCRFRRIFAGFPAFRSPPATEEPDAELVDRRLATPASKLLQADLLTAARTPKLAGRK